MTNLTYVGIAEGKLLRNDGVLACSALGSCVAVCLWERDMRLAGLVHVLLPVAKDSNARANPYKFADTGVEHLVRDMERRGASRARIAAKLVGGASLFRTENAASASEIGALNVETARDTLRRLQIPVVAEHVGGTHGRCVHFHAFNFEVRITVLTQGVWMI